MLSVKEKGLKSKVAILNNTSSDRKEVKKARELGTNVIPDGQSHQEWMRLDNGSNLGGFVQHNIDNI